MEITITVSEKTAEIIQHKAEENGKDVAEFAKNLLEEKVSEEFPETLENESDEEYENPFTPFIGMFSSGKTDTSERMHEILYSEDFDPAKGFSVKK
jgi:hypothetical protein